MEPSKENLLTALSMSLENIAVEAQLNRPHNVEKLQNGIVELFEKLIDEGDRLQNEREWYRKERDRIKVVLEPFSVIGKRLQDSISAGVGWVDMLVSSKSPIINRGYLYTDHFIEAYKAIGAAEDGTTDR